MRAVVGGPVWAGRWVALLLSVQWDRVCPISHQGGVLTAAPARPPRPPRPPVTGSDPRGHRPAASGILYERPPSSFCGFCGGRGEKQEKQQQVPEEQGVADNRHAGLLGENHPQVPDSAPLHPRCPAAHEVVPGASQGTASRGTRGAGTRAGRPGPGGATAQCAELGCPPHPPTPHPPPGEVRPRS